MVALMSTRISLRRHSFHAATPCFRISSWLSIPLCWRGWTRPAKRRGVSRSSWVAFTLSKALDDEEQA
jgi:hypothetical protein